MADGLRDEDGLAGDSDGYQSEDMRGLIQTWKGMTDGWWNQAGYETYWDYVQASEKQWARMGFDSIYKKRHKRPKSEDLPDSSPPDIDLNAVAADATRLWRAS